jgi:flagellum-specific peptidoglycan hydrolase FlgJ
LSKQQSFIEKHKQAAIRSTFGKALFPSIVMAQAIIESGWGESKLASSHNNYFGIKADKGWKGDKVSFPTKEFLNGKWITKNQYFRAYPDTLTGWKDRNSFLEVNPRYTTNGVFSASTPEKQAEALKKAGYATDPEYPKKLISIIERYNLKELDIEKTKSEGVTDKVVAFGKKNTMAILGIALIAGTAIAIMILNKNKITKQINKL